MKLTRKQVSLGALAALTVVAVPIATVISCGSDSNDDKTGMQESQNEKNIIDVSSMQSPKELISEINKKLNNIMPESAYEMSKRKSVNGSDKLTKESFDKISKYMNGINTSIDKITLKFKNGSVKLDFSEMSKAVNKVKSEIKKYGYAGVHETDAAEAMKADNETPAIYVLGQSKTSFLAGAGIIGFANLPGKAFEGYGEMLAAYHKIALQLLSTNEFKDWIKGKQYEFFKYDNNDGVITGNGPRFNYDDKNDRKKLMDSFYGLVKSAKFIEEGNNFEGQWILSVMGLTK